ncbi:hypothetical protein CPB84DRAFT_1750503 [Gymnopilus junonius]|uniref:Uncharacterized protein n=1 Tax=Gymnopilus junonius TaxID=109634 RepID=A0A9P5NHL2_GYMJU|nr:hypothetical protein CPB84DRAFT_1750503 [Gymnopilus junonius]
MPNNHHSTPLSLGACPLQALLLACELPIEQQFAMELRVFFMRFLGEKLWMILNALGSAQQDTQGFNFVDDMGSSSDDNDEIPGLESLLANPEIHTWTLGDRTRKFNGSTSQVYKRQEKRVWKDWPTWSSTS